VSKITAVEITDFAFEARNIGRVGLGQLVGYRKGAVTGVVKNAIVVETDDGLRGEYVTNWGGTPATRGEMEMLAPFLIGRDALEREGLFDDLKRESGSGRAWARARSTSRCGISPARSTARR
jgi:L-alanine-DL-glutamate epimerase-like enolase superfamily enzyme